MRVYVPADRVAVGVVQGIRRAGVTRVADPVVVGVFLTGFGHGWTVVLRVRHAVVVRVDANHDSVGGR